ncbi:MAG TPA: hypothetical protein VNG12_12480 [Acidimicrobiales bacterium]|nr:hypothetical protein [Acidimicrobiales bacterium]
MTLRSYIEQRQGKKLSKVSVAHTKAALTSLKTLLANAGEDDDTEPIAPGTLAGADGTIGAPDMAAGQVSAPDGTGMRAGHAAGATTRLSNGQQIEVR